MELSFDLDELTIGDIEDIEDIVGKPYESINWQQPSMKLVKAMIFISERRKNAAFTIDDARHIKITDFTVVEPNPTQGGDAS